ncbi:unnamed protein product [Alopecurus aequalis]
MVPISPIKCALLLSILLCCLAHGSEAAGAAILQSMNCSTAANYTSTDAYVANLNQLLADILDTTVSKNGGFFNGSVGGSGAPGTAYGLALCSADFARSDCRDCLALATSNSSGLLKQCPGSSTVLAMYDQCLVHYSNAEFLGTAYTDIVYASTGETSLASKKQYSDDLKQGFTYLSAQAAKSSERFAMSQASPYAMVQCTWDTPPEGCKACLDLLAANMSDFMTIKTTGEAKTYSCRARHSNDSFAVFPFEAVATDAPLNNRTDGVIDTAGTARGSSNRTVIAAVVSVGAAVAIFLGVTVAAYCRRGRRARRAGSITMGGASVNVDHVQVYTYEELKKATSNFSKESELGRGAFGVVYKGTLENQKVVAVKKLQRMEKVDATQFMNEVSILSGLKHKNLVKLEGYCVHEQEGLLCYEYLPDGTLEDRLYGKQQHAAKLSWKERHHVLVGISRGLRYLHDETPNEISVMHMDLKTDNILLQEDKAKENLTPKISDFGISRNLDADKQHEYVVQVVGNVSCVPREFIERGKASTKVDIYSFGLIILEVVTGKPRSSWSTAEEKRYSEGFIKQVREHWEKKDVIDKLKDPSMDSDCHDEIEKCIELALECVHEEPDKRPDIATVTRRITDIGNFKKQEKP